MRWALAALGLVGGCGRIAFDARSDAQSDSASDAAPVTYRDAVLQDRPIAYWRFGSADFGHDEMGTYDATFTGTCAAATGALTGDPDAALQLDGASCRGLTPPGGLEFQGNTPFTLEMWLRENRTDLFQIFFMKETRTVANGPMDGYALLLGPSGVYLERIVNTTGNTTNDVPIPTAQWLHIVATYDGANVQMYIDGAQVGPSNAAPEVMPAVPMQASIGSIVSFGNYVDGDMDELAIYDHALSPERIAKHHELGLNGPTTGN